MDKEFLDIVNDILTNEEYLKLKNYKHHGLTRYDHTVRVAYWSYKIAKWLRLDYKSISRGGLLHDFFFINNQKISLGERIKVFVIHPRMALENSLKYFKLSKKEENIILSHMFPLYFILPTSLESIIVGIVDDIVAIYDRIKSLFKKDDN